MTGVAASNTGGSTVHAFFQLRKEGNSGLYIDAQAAYEFRTVPCLQDPSHGAHGAPGAPGPVPWGADYIRSLFQIYRI